MVSQDLQLNLAIKSDIVYLLIFLTVLNLCIGTRVYSVLISNNCASWSDKPFVIGVTV